MQENIGGNMKQKKSFKAGNASTLLKGDGLAAVDELLKIVTPESQKVIQDEFAKIEEQAKKNWLVRQPAKNGAWISKGSKNKIYTGIKVGRNQKIRFVIGNDAPYAWAIKVGVDSDTNLPRGTRIANELLWKPSKKATDIIVNAIADELMKKMK